MRNVLTGTYHQADKTHRQKENHPIEDKRKDREKKAGEKRLRSLDLLVLKSDWEQRKKAKHCLPRLVQWPLSKLRREHFRGIEGKEETKESKERESVK